MAKLSKLKYFNLIQTKSPSSFTIGNTKEFNDYTGEGICEEIKVPISIKFKSLSDSLAHPYAPGKTEMDNCDFEKFGRPE